MNSRTHRNLAKIFYPHLKYREIDRVNSIIDSPSRTAKTLSQAVGTVLTPNPETGKLEKRSPFDVFNLGNIPHRRVGHDPVTATAIALAEMGPIAIEPTFLHLMGDMWSESIKKDGGVAARDLWEAVLNYNLEDLIKGSPKQFNFRTYRSAEPRKHHRRRLIRNKDGGLPYY